MQRQQSKKAPKKQSQRAAFRKQSKKSSILLQGGSFRQRQDMIPAAYSYESMDPTWLRMEGKVNHPELGGGVRIAGRQMLTSIATSAGDSQLFVANGATITDINSIRISPDLLNGRLALQARNYDRYAFRKLSVQFVSRVPTTQAGSFALGYVSDRAPSVTFANVTSMCPCMQSTFYTKSNKVGFTIIDDMNSTKTWFTLYDPTDTATTRQTVQGTLVGAPDSSSIGAVSQGFLYVDYLIDLYQPTIDQGFTLRLTDVEEAAILKGREREKELKSKKEDPSDEVARLQLRIKQLKFPDLSPSAV